MGRWPSCFEHLGFLLRRIVFVSPTKAVAFGLPKAEALRAVTLSTAEILGVGERLGSIEPGKAATLIVTTGDPLEITTDTLLAFIDGREIALGNRQKTLYEKYLRKYAQREPGR